MVSADVTGSALSGIASGLSVPVHIVAVLLMAVLALELGRVLAEAWRRVRPGTEPLERVALAAMRAPAQAAALAHRAPGPLSEQAVLDLAAAAPVSDLAVENALADYELAIQRRLDRTRMLVRAGPAVGLMGTLIPLAPGLSKLGAGNFAPLADDLKVAFAATVVGLLVGTGAFALTLVRTRIYTEDLAGLERAVAARGGVVPARIDAVGPAGTIGEQLA